MVSFFFFQISFSSQKKEKKKKKKVHMLLFTHRSFDGKVKVWSMDTRTCVATYTEMDKAVWSAKWLPPPPALPPSVAAAAAAGAGTGGRGRSEMFAVAGANRSISFYREATGG